MVGGLDPAVYCSKCPAISIRMNPTFLPSPTTCCPGLQLIYCALGCSQHKLQYSKSFCSILQGDRAQPQPLAACHTKLGGCSGDGAQGLGAQEGSRDPGSVRGALDQSGKFPREFWCPANSPRPPNLHHGARRCSILCLTELGVVLKHCHHHGPHKGPGAGVCSPSSPSSWCNLSRASVSPLVPVQPMLLPAPARQLQHT